MTSVIGEEQCSLDQMPEIFEYFREMKLSTDITFSVKCDDEWMDFSAHKLILSMWSPLLAEMCNKPCSENDGVIRIENVSSTTFDAILKFMYGSFSNQQLKDIFFSLKLYEAAATYEIDALKNLCSDVFISSTPSKHNVFQLLDAGKLLNCEVLVQRCYKILQKNTAEVLVAQELCNITPAMLLTILDMPRVSLSSEYELISWVLAWVKNELLKDPYQKCFKDIFADFLPYLNFLNLTAAEFAKLCQSRKGDLMSEQDGFSIFMNIALPGSHPLPSFCSCGPKQREYPSKSSGRQEDQSSFKEKSSKYQLSFKEKNCEEDQLPTKKSSSNKVRLSKKKRSKKCTMKFP